jgi:hypothetical protein
MGLSEHMSGRACCLMLLCGFLTGVLAVPARGDPLQGRIEETQKGTHNTAPPSMKDEMEAKLDMMELQGGAQGTGLNGSLQSGGFNPLQGSAASGPGPFNLNAATNMPAGEQELQIAWEGMERRYANCSDCCDNLHAL